MQTRWPLHPKPYSNETLDRYVRRLSQCYCVNYETFCLRALNIPIEDSHSKLFRNPTSKLLQRLSDGSGIAISVLEKMVIKCHQIEELNQYTAATPVKPE